MSGKSNRNYNFSIYYSLQSYLCAMFYTIGYILFYSLLSVTLLLLFYYLYFFARLAFYTSKRRNESLQHPVSVIVCAKDEERNLTKNLPKILEQAYSSTTQVLVVNDNSADDSRFTLQDLNRTFKNLTVVDLQNEAKHIAGKKYPLSIGIKEAKNEILLLTDADCIPASENWVFKMQSGYDDYTDIVLGYGAYEKLPGFLNIVIRFETFHTALQYLSYALAGLPYMGVGRNLSYKKNLFLKNKGFASINHLPGGDDDLFINKIARKNNTAIVIDPEAHTISTPKKTWKDWKWQKTRHFSTSKYYKPKHKFLLGLYSLSHFLFYPLVITTAIVFDWRLTLIIFFNKLLTQQIIFSKVMKKLNEPDLIKWIFIMDIWMMGYYIMFAPKLLKRASKNW
ncbi:MAG: glycosyltransferase [Niabella sp.]